MKEYMKEIDIGDKSIGENQQCRQVQKQSINYNGFTHFPSIFQILPILYAFYMLAELTIIMEKIQKLEIKIPIIIFFALIFLVCSCLWYLTTKIDPTDSIQIKHRNAILSEQQFSANQHRHFCHICQTCVSKNGFHCRKCNRCVQMFDHHCRWLNNCIGAKNYFQFFYLICSTQILIVYHIIVNSIQLAWVIRQIEKIDQISWLFYLEIITITLDFVLFCFCSLLFAMHIYLITQRKTTIQLIREMRGQNKIHPSHKNNDISSKKQQFPQQCESAQDWKISDEHNKYKIQELIISKRQPNQELVKKEKIQSQANKGIVKVASSKMAPLKLVKFRQKISE